MADELALNLEFVRKALVGFLAEELDLASASCYVVGLSGGVDSALAAALAVEAVGPARVVALAMPGPTSDPQSLEDAKLAAQHLGLELEVIPLDSVVTPLIDLVGASGDRVRVGNLHARLRMVILFDKAKREQGLVLGTSNKSEVLLGYSTLFGDSAASVQPLGDLFKTQVWELARYMGLPKRIVDKPPTADLWPGQSDEDELGFGYREADRVLYWFFDRGLSLESIVKLGFDRRAVERVIRTHLRARFKWRPTVTARLSSSAVNIDRILPRNPEL